MADQHHDQHHDQHDDQHDALRDALARLDPAAALPPADPARTARQLEDVMTTPETAPRPVRSRRLRVLSAVAAAAVVLTASGIALTRGGDDASVPSADGSPTPAASQAPGASVTLTAGGGAGIARCGVPRPALLGQAAVAVDGTVTAIEDGVASVAVAKVYAGDPDLSTVKVQVPSARLAELLSVTDLSVGQRYLLAGQGPTLGLMVCGYSGPRTTALSALYDQAFGG